MPLKELIKKITDINYGSVRKKIVSFLRDELETSGKEGYILALVEDWTQQ